MEKQNLLYSSIKFTHGAKHHQRGCHTCPGSAAWCRGGRSSRGSCWAAPGSRYSRGSGWGAAPGGQCSGGSGWGRSRASQSRILPSGTEEVQEQKKAQVESQIMRSRSRTNPKHCSVIQISCSGPKTNKLKFCIRQKIFHTLSSVWHSGYPLVQIYILCFKLMFTRG